MKIELDGTPLSDTQVDATGGILGARSVSNINVTDERNLVNFDVPGMNGSAFQDMGRKAVEISFDGMVMGANAKSVIEQVRSKFKAGKPVPFTSDVSGAADVTKVVIDLFTLADFAGNKDRYDYSIVLREYIEPPTTPPAPNTAATTAGTGAGEEGEEAGEGGKEGAGGEDEATKFVDDEAKKSGEGVNMVSGRVLDADGNPRKGVTVNAVYDGDERTAVTDDKGIYKFENLPPGKWKSMVVEDEEYTGREVTLTIGEGGDEEGH